MFSDAYVCVRAGSSIYCDTLSVSQYDSKVRSDPLRRQVMPLGIIEQSFLSA